jgi:hypothetical protein
MNALNVFHTSIISGLEIEKSRFVARLDKSIISWQGRQSVDQTFEDEIKFEIEEIRAVLDEPIYGDEASC